MKFNPLINSAQKLFGRKADERKDFHSEKTVDDSTLVMSEGVVSEQASDVSLPDLVARKYIVHRTIGKGAFGTVYLAEDKKIGRFVAIKQLIKRVSEKRGKEIYERFMQEARIGAQLDHPNIINVFALEEDRNSACIIMEYLAGGSLAARIKEKKKLSLSEAIRIMSGIFSGLEAAHGVMVTHRDVKPQNILFGANEDPKITDFGVALLPSAFGGLPDYIQTPGKTVVGTPIYMAPEQISGNNIDSRADLYSAGAVMYEMFAGKKLFTVDDVKGFDDLRRKVLYSPPDPIDNPEVPKEIEGFIFKLLAKDINARYQGAGEALEALLAIRRKIESDHSQIKDLHENHFDMSSLSASAMLEDVIRLFLIDGNISPAEKRELDRRSERLGFTKSQARSIEEKVRADLSLVSLKDIEKYEEQLEYSLSQSSELVLTSQQMLNLENLRSKMGMSEDDAQNIYKAVLDRIKYRRRIEEKKIKF